MTLRLPPRPAALIGGNRDYTAPELAWIARQFEIPEIESVEPFEGRGNINLHTYLVGTDARQYLLQKVNSDVFRFPYRVMHAMQASLAAQGAASKDLGWEPITLVAARDGQPFLDLTDDHGWSVWRLMERIPGVLCHKSLGEAGDRAAQLDRAQEAGRGLAIYHDLTASIDPGQIEGSLPGYRDTALYLAQLKSVLAENQNLDRVEGLPADAIVLRSTQDHFLLHLDPAEHRWRRKAPGVAAAIETVLEAEGLALELVNGMAEGRVRRTLIHGDTKIENFLFDARTGRVRSLVDLDTIMPFTWLADWGDMVRSMANVAGEKETDLDRVRVDWDIYAAVERGFLSAASAATPSEIGMMRRAAAIIALELGARFLTDYLRGDNYFGLGPEDAPDLNRTRALVQLELFRQFSGT
jgi:hypothetical protein